MFFCGLREEKVYLANLSVLLRGLYADHVKRLGFFALPSRTVRGKGGVAMLCGAPSRAAYVQRMGIRGFIAPLREFTAGTDPYRGSSDLRSARGRELAARKRISSFFTLFY